MLMSRLLPVGLPGQQGYFGLQASIAQDGLGDLHISPVSRLCCCSKEGIASRSTSRRLRPQHRAQLARQRASASQDEAWRSSISTQPQGQQKVQAKRAVTNTSGGNGVFWLLLCNTALFVLDHIAKQSWVHSLYLFNAHPRWWQFITSAFCHTSFEHLSGNMFMLYVFGRIVEEEEGPGGVWCTYLICALGASVATLLLQANNTVSLGASGAVFGMFTMGVLCKFRFSFKKLLECAILGQFVVKQVIQEVQAQAARSAGWGTAQVVGVQVGHIAHLAGALAGVLLVLLLSRLPSPSADSTAA